MTSRLLHSNRAVQTMTRGPKPITGVPIVKLNVSLKHVAVHCCHDVQVCLFVSLCVVQDTTQHCVHTCPHVVYTPRPAHTHIHTRRTHTSTRTHAHTHMHTHTHVYTHTYTHTHTLSLTVSRCWSSNVSQCHPSCLLAVPLTWS